MKLRISLFVILALLTPNCDFSSVHAQDVSAVSETAWTEESATEELKLRPNDPYIQFVVSQFQSKSGADSPAAQTRQDRDQQRALAARRNQNVDLFRIFSGALAVQESLQLDALAGQQGNRSEARNIDIATLQGPTVQSHPWRQMLAGKSPEVSELADCVPADQLFVRFESVSKLLAMRKLADEYGTYITSQTKQRAFYAGRVDEIQQQLAMQVNNMLRPVYDAAIAEVAVTSSDLYFSHGTDVTLLMRLNERSVIRSQLDSMLDEAAKQPGAIAKAEEYLGVPLRHVVTADRRIHVYSAFPRPNLHVRSNSRMAMRRVLATILNKPLEGKSLQPLGQTEEYQYIRSLMPIGAEEEDGIVYMSDPFIRELIGPTKKLTHRSRQLCNANLQILAYSSLMYRTQHGKLASSPQQLQQGDCLGRAANPLQLHCPDGGQYTLTEDGTGGCCSHHGCLHNLNPVCEIPLHSVSADEQSQYKRFVTQYSRYWQTFFDPIAIRIRHTPEKTRVETIVLPLINNSIYQSMAAALGSEPEQLNALPLPNSTIFSVAARLDKKQLFSQWGIVPPEDDSASTDDEAVARDRESIDQVANSLQGIALAMLNFEDAYQYLPPHPQDYKTAEGRKNPQPSGLSWRVHILQFLGEAELYNKFHHDEPWDSEHNRELIEQMPEVYYSGNSDLENAGKTRFTLPFHATAAHHSKSRGVAFREILDGTSNTILVVVADKDNAAVWTKPDDLAIDMSDPREGWSQGVKGQLPIARVDGSVATVTQSLSDDQVRSLLTRAGGEPIDFDLPRLRVTRNRRRSISPFAGFIDEEKLGLPSFLYDGIGNQVGIHVCDSDPLIDFNVARFLGMVGGSFDGRDSFMMGPGLMLTMLGMSLNVPTYVSIPVEDEQIVDNFLNQLDLTLVELSRELSRESSPFIEIDQDTYRIPAEGKSSVRAYVIRFGPLAWRFYWLRIDDGLYIASKPFIVEHLRQAHSQRKAAPDRPVIQSHGLVHARPQLWNQAKSHYTIGWLESESRACQNNLGPISDLARAVGSLQTGIEDDTVAKLGERAFHANYFCPCGGHYHQEVPGAAVECSVHGSLDLPTQPRESVDSNLVRLTDHLGDVSLHLSFLDDGLHAIVTVERK